MYVCMEREKERKREREQEGKFQHFKSNLISKVPKSPLTTNI